MKKISYLLSFNALLVSLAGCGSDPSTNNKKDSTPNHYSEKYSKYEAISYPGVVTVDDINAYAGEVVKNGHNNDDPLENGIVNCPFYTLKINDEIVPVYSTRCGNGVHSFAAIDVDTSENIYLEVELALNNYHKSVVVLPQSSGIEATLENSVVSSTINKVGNFSFAFDKKPDEGLTLYVYPKEEFKAPSGYNVVKYDPGTYKIADLAFTEEDTVYYFKKGRYTISAISLPSNSVLYFESGTYLDVVTEYEGDHSAGISARNKENIRICGHGLLDFSSNQGGTAGFQGKGMFNYVNCSNLTMEGIVSINGVSWTLCLTNCDNCLIQRNMIYGFRTCSDGIMLADCQDCNVRYNFVRTGDDAIEAKSTGSEGSSNNIYEYNAVWTDKARGYGCIYESNNDMNGIYFRHNSVGFSLATWADFLGCCTVILGTRKETVWQNIHFEDIEIYMTYNPIINIYLGDTSNLNPDGGCAKNLYFQDITAYRAYDRALHIRVQGDGLLGKVYIDNLNYNQTLFTEKSLKDDAAAFIVNSATTGWSVSKNVLINTLNDEDDE